MPFRRLKRIAGDATVQDSPPNWLPLSTRLREAQTLAGTNRQPPVLRAIIDDIIQTFERCPPTPWEAHFLLHAIRHLDGGYPAVAVEEIRSVFKPREQQCTTDLGFPRPLSPSGRRLAAVL
jgi:hypothetical protein